MTKCDVCGEREQTLGGFISWDESGTAITRTCDECKTLGFEKARELQQEKLSNITFADGLES
jgi:hypothetical protein